MTYDLTSCCICNDKIYFNLTVINYFAYVVVTVLTVTVICDTKNKHAFRLFTFHTVLQNNYSQMNYVAVLKGSCEYRRCMVEFLKHMVFFRIL